MAPSALEVVTNNKQIRPWCSARRAAAVAHLRSPIRPLLDQKVKNRLKTIKNDSLVGFSKTREGQQVRNSFLGSAAPVALVPALGSNSSDAASASDSTSISTRSSISITSSFCSTSY